MILTGELLFWGNESTDKTRNNIVTPGWLRSHNKKGWLGKIVLIVLWVVSFFAMLLLYINLASLRLPLPICGLADPKIAELVQVDNRFNLDISLLRFSVCI